MEKAPISENQTEVKKEKVYLYHMVPEDMQGTTLHPLNSMKGTHPELYLSKAAKYTGRERVMENFIPTLECAWNDVLHFSAVNPEEIKKSLIEAGMSPRQLKFYQIDPSLLDPEKTTIYLYQEKMSEDKMNKENFSEYNSEKLAEHSILPQVTKDYYKEKFGKSERPLMFVGVPHILHKGSVDISDFPVIVV
ncbi:MAG: hypothetical protein AAB628_02040 [Patescibacteria group bacterium]